MREYLVRINPCLTADLFHLPPDVTPVHGLSAARDEYHTGYNVSLSCICLKKPAQSVGQEYGSYLSLAVHLRNLLIHRIHRNEAQLGYTDSGGAYGLQQQAKPLIPLTAGNVHKPYIFLP